MNAQKTLPAVIPHAKGLLAQGKALIGFYKTGVLNVWNNRKLSKSILKSYNAPSGYELVKAYVEYSHISRIKAKLETPPTETAPASSGLTREQLQTVLRTQRDFFKIPVFAVVLAVFFEITPIILWAVPRIAPSTCFSLAYRKQLAEAFSKNRQKLQSYKSNKGMDFALSVHRLESPQVRQLAVTVLPGAPIIYRMAPLSWLRNRLQQHIIEIRADDEFLRKGDLNELDNNELELACQARAIDIDQLDNAKRASLALWAAQFTEPADAGYFITQARDDIRA